MNRRTFFRSLFAAGALAAARVWAPAVAAVASQSALAGVSAAVAWDRIASDYGYTSKCPYQFCDTACGYDGPLEDCDKTIAACIERGNERNFGGMIHALPSPEWRRL